MPTPMNSFGITPCTTHTLASQLLYPTNPSPYPLFIK